MPDFHVNIVDWAAWGPRASGAADPSRWQVPPADAHGTSVSAPAKAVSAGFRRRLSAFGRAAAEAAEHALGGKQAMIVFASRHGDIHRTARLLEQVVGPDDLSPTDFSMSVHNAVAGILSISWKVTLPITSVAAGEDTLSAGFTEALALAQNHADIPVLLVYVDVELPTVYEKFQAEGEAAFALAVLLQVGEPAGGVVTQVTCHPWTAPNTQIGLTKQAQDMAIFLSGLGHDFSFGSKRSGWTLKRA